MHDEDATEHLIHGINNLLGVIEAQVAVAQATGTPESAQRALELIHQAARKTGDVVQRARGLDGARHPGGEA